MKKYAGEEFLNRLYKDLVHSDEVNHTAKGANKNEDLRIYLDRIDRITKRASESDRLDLLKHFYYKKYVIKEEDIPESYFRMQEQIALERGYGHITYNKYEKETEINSIISEQKESLNKWLDYFSGDETNHYPMWFKYYVFQNVMQIGYFDKEKNTFTKRNNSTVKPFIEVNREAIAMLYDELYKYLDNQEIPDDILQQLMKNGSFNKIYSYIIKKLDSVNKIKSNSNEGIWKKYDQGSNPKILFDDIYGKGTGWCTAGGIETAKSHLDGGDFYVYYTKDDKGKYTNPRIAIRMENDKIAEIRGVAENQNIENDMESVVEEKFNEFPDKDEYKKKVSDMKKLTMIYNKQQKYEELTKEELRFLYEIDTKIIGFGYEEDPRIEEIISCRDAREDLPFALGVSKEKISFNKKQALKGNIKYHFGDLYMGMLSNTKDIVFPKEVHGNLYLDCLTNVDGLVLPEKIKGNLFLRDLNSAKNIVFPKEIDGDLYLDNLINSDNLVLPEIVNGNLSLKKLTSAKNTIFPKKMGGSLHLTNLTDVENLVLPEKIEGYLDIRNLIDSKGITLPKEVKKTLFLNNLIDARGLVLPEKIGGGLDLRSLINAEGMIFPKIVGEYLDLRSLVNIGNLSLPETIGNDILLDNLVSADYIIFPINFNGFFVLESLEDIKNIKLPKNEQDEFYVPGNLICPNFNENELIELAIKAKNNKMK